MTEVVILKKREEDEKWSEHLRLRYVDGHSGAVATLAVDLGDRTFHVSHFSRPHEVLIEEVHLSRFTVAAQEVAVIRGLGGRRDEDRLMLNASDGFTYRIFHASSRGVITSER